MVKKGKVFFLWETGNKFKSIITFKKEFLIWLMLQTMTVGKKTSERGAVVVWMVVTTVLLLKSMMAVAMKKKATPSEATSIRIQTNCSFDVN